MVSLRSRDIPMTWIGHIVKLGTINQIMTVGDVTIKDVELIL